MAYSWLTFSQAKTQLAAVLGDPSNVFWADAELGIYITEAIRTWAAFSFYYKQRGGFNTAVSTAFYDLPTQLPSLLAYSVTDRQLITEIQYHLLETATNGGSWAGTDQFTYQDVVNALQRRLNQFLLESGMVLTFGSSVVVNPVSGRFTLSDTVIDLRRGSWLTTDNTHSVLWREDEWAISTYDQQWTQTPATPVAYSVSVTPPLEVQLAPPPAANGTFEYIATLTGATLDPASTGTILGVPDDHTPTIKWGTLADLLAQDGQGTDPARVAYCEQRWQEGIALAKLSTTMMQAQVNGVTVYTDSLWSLDASDGSWQNTEDEPLAAVMAGLNVIGFSPVPDGAYGITLDVVRKAPVPTADGDFIQIGREEWEAVLGYSQHLASFKMHGEDFAETNVWYDRMVRLAALKNDRLRANARYFKALMDRTQLEEQRRPRQRKKVGA